MTLVDRIKQLCSEKNITLAELERQTGISNGQIRRWDTSSPKLDNIKKVADYFNVSIDFLTGRDKVNFSLNEDDPILQQFLQSPKAIEFMKKINSSDESELNKLDLLWEIIHEKKN
ncbi:helix-turn-helix domain-containing protein [Listeria booriae]|uniref:Helix-turn-helix transcriptional regulator n=1 Tax=Listeria booriae TaxID=1552123 RepID=A0A841ZWE6_9LIST|nr:helix-turn-helix transcriptional regulator [Listeria booriae]MBC1565079.1 helix-turn-helix transcriptional regulator [Listeria booriae]